ncbi:hypothetical protein E2C01_068790 [Portunus trituberculatus]|uniref:Uncharacterized protein n=1 Tax=Portunus trituberculatus TaxID=210409 RepID=A0A5B7HSY5_PORTR|nr:hypothetical protein [Portunus trituberculatus]
MAASGSLPATLRLAERHPRIGAHFRRHSSGPRRAMPLAHPQTLDSTGWHPCVSGDGTWPDGAPAVMRRGNGQHQPRRERERERFFFVILW